MKVYVDDERTPRSQDWKVIRDPEHALLFISERHERITHISLDHDLGPEGTMNGYDLLMNLLRRFNYALPFSVAVHTANPEAGKRMREALKDQERFRKMEEAP